MLVGSHNSRVDHRVLVVGVLGQDVEHPLPHATFGPAAVPRMHHPEVAETLRQVAPRDARPVALQHRLDEQAVVPSRYPHIPLTTR